MTNARTVYIEDSTDGISSIKCPSPQKTRQKFAETLPLILDEENYSKIEKSVQSVIEKSVQSAIEKSVQSAIEKSIIEKSAKSVLKDSLSSKEGSATFEDYRHNLQTGSMALVFEDQSQMQP